MTKLLGLQYQVVYKKGVENKAADALSRKVVEKHGELIVVSTCVLTWLQELAEGYKHDVQTSRVLSELGMGTSNHPKFQMKDGSLRYAGRICVDSNTSLQ